MSTILNPKVGQSQTTGPPLNITNIHNYILEEVGKIGQQLKLKFIVRYPREHRAWKNSPGCATAQEEKGLGSKVTLAKERVRPVAMLTLAATPVAAG